MDVIKKKRDKTPDFVYETKAYGEFYYFCTIMIGLSYNEMKKRIIFLGCIMGIITLLSGCSSHRNLSMLQFNIWQEGTMIPGGFDPSLMK